MSISDNQYQEISERLEMVRKKFSDQSAKAWSEANGFNPTQYSNWVRGIRRISVDAAIVLCDRYGLTLDFIYRGRVDGLSDAARRLLFEERP